MSVEFRRVVEDGVRLYRGALRLCGREVPVVIERVGRWWVITVNGLYFTRKPTLTDAKNMVNNYLTQGDV